MECGQVNEVLFEHLFMEIVYHHIEQSKIEGHGQPDYDLAFYQIERIGFTMGQRIIERYADHWRANGMRPLGYCMQPMLSAPG